MKWVLLVLCALATASRALSTDNAVADAAPRLSQRMVKMARARGALGGGSNQQLGVRSVLENSGTHEPLESPQDGTRTREKRCKYVGTFFKLCAILFHVPVVLSR